MRMRNGMRGYGGNARVYSYYYLFVYLILVCTVKTSNIHKILCNYYQLKIAPIHNGKGLLL
jgi:hypothetical protein